MGTFTLRIRPSRSTSAFSPSIFYRLVEMRRLIRQVRNSANAELSMDWLKPFMTKRAYKKGKIVFRKNDRAYEMYYVVTGKFLVTEIG